MNANTALFTKQQRILTPAQYKAVFDKRQSQHDQFCGVYAANNAQAMARLGMVVAKKVSKKAVVRNKIKRQLREYFRQQTPPFKAIDFVVVVKPPITTLSTIEIHQALSRLFNRAQNKCKK